MNPKKELLNAIIKSLDKDYQDWNSSYLRFMNKKIEVEICEGITPVFDIHIYYPCEIKFSFFDRIRLYKAVKRCKTKTILNKINNGKAKI